jgi:hypothetical protein
MSQEENTGRVSIPLQRELESARAETWQYYYKNPTCSADSAYSDNCICWHNEGVGAFINARHDDPETWNDGIPRNWRLR